MLWVYYKFYMHVVVLASVVMYVPLWKSEHKRWLHCVYWQSRLSHLEPVQALLHDLENLHASLDPLRFSSCLLSLLLLFLLLSETYLEQWIIYWAHTHYRHTNMAHGHHICTPHCVHNHSDLSNWHCYRHNTTDIYHRQSVYSGPLEQCLSGSQWTFTLPLPQASTNLISVALDTCTVLLHTEAQGSFYNWEIHTTLSPVWSVNTCLLSCDSQFSGSNNLFIPISTSMSCFDICTPPQWMHNHNDLAADTTTDTDTGTNNTGTLHNLVFSVFWNSTF